MVMIGIGALRDEFLSWKTVVYLFSFVIIQMVMVTILFEFMRKPWDGVELEIEKALELQQNKILEDSISFMSLNE